MAHCPWTEEGSTVNHVGRAPPGTDTWSNPAQRLDGFMGLGWLQRYVFLHVGDDAM